jgi:hypothetical protein
VGVWEGTREGTWQVLLFLERTEVVKEIAKVLAQEYKQQFVAIVWPTNKVEFVAP